MGGLEGTLGARSCSASTVDAEASTGASMAERLRSRSSGGRFNGCVSAEKCWREEVPVREFFRMERGSRSFVGFVGDLEPESLLADLGVNSGALEFDRDSLSGFFLGEDFEKKAGRTMEDDDGTG